MAKSNTIVGKATETFELIIHHGAKFKIAGTSGEWQVTEKGRGISINLQTMKATEIKVVEIESLTHVGVLRTVNLYASILRGEITLVPVVRERIICDKHKRLLSVAIASYISKINDLISLEPINSNLDKALKEKKADLALLEKLTHEELFVRFKS
jgi:hypothetical protein